jgi:hypothetical protein
MPYLKISFYKTVSIFWRKFNSFFNHCAGSLIFTYLVQETRKAVIFFLWNNFRKRSSLILAFSILPSFRKDHREKKKSFKLYKTTRERKLLCLGHNNNQDTGRVITIPCPDVIYNTHRKDKKIKKKLKSHKSHNI